MSVYNLARYNLAKFNVVQADSIWAVGRARTTVAFSYAGITNLVIGNAAVRFDAEQMRLDPGRMIIGSTGMTFANQSKVNAYFWRQATAATVWSKEINLSQEAYIVGTESTTFDPKINLSQEAYVSGAESTTLDPDVNLSQQAFVSGNAGEVFSQTADVIVLTESICSFPGLTLKPGQVLTIDAGSYNVLLDGENAIYLQEGDWLDNLSRDTINITASATGGQRLHIQILYVERYL